VHTHIHIYIYLFFPPHLYLFSEAFRPSFCYEYQSEF
jgi:hypothetical protein